MVSSVKLFDIAAQKLPWNPEMYSALVGARSMRATSAHHAQVVSCQGSPVLTNISEQLSACMLRVPQWKVLVPSYKQLFKSQASCPLS